MATSLEIHARLITEETLVKTGATTIGDSTIAGASASSVPSMIADTMTTVVISSGGVSSALMSLNEEEGVGLNFGA
jgi:hypothetical protein